MEEKERPNDVDLEPEHPCPICGEELEVVSRCMTCHYCGFSLCSV